MRPRALVAVAAAVVIPAGATARPNAACSGLRCLASVPSGSTIVADARGIPTGYVTTATTGSVALSSLEGATRWRTSVAPAVALPRVVALGDFTGDAIPDVVLWVMRADPPAPCGGAPTFVSLLVFVDGRTGLQSQPIPPIPDICWDMPNFNYATHQWDFGTVYIGDLTTRVRGNEVVVTPYYSTEGIVLNFAAQHAWQRVTGRDGRTTFPFPSVPEFDRVYDATNPRPCAGPFGAPPCYIQYAHVANAVFVPAPGGSALFTFTSNRSVIFRPDLTPAADVSWLPGDTAANGGRNYGLVETYTAGRRRFVDLIAGCSVEFTRRAIASGVADGGDTNCGITRHFERFAVAGTSSTHVGGVYYGYLGIEGSLQGRVEFPAHAHAAIGGKGTAWTVFDVLRDGHWFAELFAHPTDTRPVAEVRDRFVWDTADVDGDGSAELLATTIPAGGAIPPRSFDVVRWNGAGLTSLFHVDGLSPALVRFASTPMRHTTESNVFSAVTARFGRARAAEILVEDGRGVRSWLRWKSG